MPDDSSLNIDDAASFLSDDETPPDNTEAIVDDVEVDDELNGNFHTTRTSGEEDEPEGEKATKEDGTTEEDGEKKGAEGEQKDDPDLLKIPHWQQIKVKYPNLFKDFPDLKGAYFFGRDVQNIFGTVDQAKQAVGALEQYQELDKAIFAGSSKEVLSELNRQGAIDGFVENFLPTLLETNREAYIQATEPVIIGVLNRVLNAGTRAGDKNIINSVKVLSREIFGDTALPEIRKKETKVDPEKERLRETISRRAVADQENFFKDVVETGERVIGAAIQKGLPASLTPYQKNAITKLAKEEIEGILKQDPAYLAAQKPLWQGAARSGFGGDWKARIVKAALARAQQSLNAVIKKHVTEFTGTAPNGSGNRNAPPRGEGKSGSAAPSGNKSNYTAKQIDTTKSSAMDILNDKVVLKR